MGRAILVCLVIGSLPVAAEPALPKHYAQLFVDGKQWTYDVRITTWDYAKIENLDPQKVPVRRWPKRTQTHVVVCSVAKVARLGAATVSQITCDKTVDEKVDIAGIYVATATGLHRYGGDVFPQTEAELAPLDPPLIAAKPKPMRKTTKEPFTDSSHFHVTLAVQSRGGAWCTSQRLDGAPHDGTRTTCFGGGIASGGNDVAGELHDVQYTVRKR